jgi:hypothetical protein
VTVHASSDGPLERLEPIDRGDAEITRAECRFYVFKSEGSRGARRCSKGSGLEDAQARPSSRAKDRRSAKKGLRSNQKDLSFSKKDLLFETKVHFQIKKALSFETEDLSFERKTPEVSKKDLFEIQMGLLVFGKDLG